MRVWTRSRPGEEDAVVVDGKLLQVSRSEALLAVGDRRLRAVPSEQGWGFHSLWFGFIAVEVFEDEQRLGRWWLRLGSRR